MPGILNPDQVLTHQHTQNIAANLLRYSHTPDLQALAQLLAQAPALAPVVVQALARALALLLFHTLQDLKPHKFHHHTDFPPAQVLFLFPALAQAPAQFQARVLAPVQVLAPAPVLALVRAHQIHIPLDLMPHRFRHHTDFPPVQAQVLVLAQALALPLVRARAPVQVPARALAQVLARALVRAPVQVQAPVQALALFDFLGNLNLLNLIVL